MIEHALFNCIPLEHQKRIVETAKQIELKKGEMLFWDEDLAQYVYYVVRGNLKVFKTSDNGNETIFDIYDPKSFIALGVLFNSRLGYPASCAAVNDAFVIALQVKALEEGIVSSPESARKWIAYMNKRLTTVQKKLSDQIFADSFERFRKLVKYFQSKYPTGEMGEYLHINVPITKQEMADLLNIRRETLSRMLTTLKEQNLCEVTYKAIIVKKKWLLKEK